VSLPDFDGDRKLEDRELMIAISYPPSSIFDFLAISFQPSAVGQKKNSGSSSQNPELLTPECWIPCYC